MSDVRDATSPARRTRYAVRLVVMGLLAALVLPPALSGAQAAPSPAGGANLLGQLSDSTDGTVNAIVRKETGLVGFLGTAAGKPVPRAKGVAADAPAATAARGFLKTYGSLFGIDEASVTVKKQERGLKGQRFVRFQQRAAGVPVIGGELVVSVDGVGNVVSANGESADTAGLGTEPAITGAAATANAVEAVAKAQGVSADSVTTGPATLAVYDPTLLSAAGIPGPRLVWQTNVDGGDRFDELVFVDAADGSIALHFDQHAEAKSRKVCDRNNVSGAPAACTSGFVRVEGGAASSIDDVNKAYDFAGDTYDFYKNKFNRDSLNNAGLPLISTTRFCDPTEACPYQNAFWNGSQMVYGDTYARGDDVVGHELTHGVTDFTSGLYYFSQSGAINESLSDVFGELIDLGNGKGNDSASVKWMLGEDLPIGAIRSLKDPTIFGDPDRVGSSNYYTGTADSEGVHTNSGVNNKAAYLMTDGATFNGKTVTGIGQDKVARVYYEAETHLITSATDYNDLFSILPQACKNLVGSNSITTADCTQVTNAVTATQMNITASGAQANVPVCSTAGQIPSNVFFDNLENTSSGNWTKSKATGSTDWQYPTSGTQNEYATSGKQNFFGDDPDAASDLRISKSTDVTIPSGTTYLRFEHAFAFETGAEYYDGGVVEYSTNSGSSWTDLGSKIDIGGYGGTLSSGNPLGARAAFDGATYGYVTTRANLSSLAGQKFRVRFRAASDSSVGNRGWFIDDVRIYRCVSGSSAPAVSAGADKNVNSGASFTVTGSATDPEGKPLAYRWTQVSGTPVTFKDPREKVVTVNPIASSHNGTDVVLKLTVIDSQGLTASDNVTLHVVAPK